MGICKIFLYMFCIKECLGDLQVSDRYNLRSARNREEWVYDRIEFSSLGFNQILAPEVQCAFACSENSTCDAVYVEAGACVFGWSNETVIECQNGGVYNDEDEVCECAERYQGERCEYGNFFIYFD